MAETSHQSGDANFDAEEADGLRLPEGIKAVFFGTNQVERVALP